MRFSTLFVAASVVVSGASAASLSARSTQTAAQALTADNYYGAPIAPWLANHVPGWYYGSGSVASGIPVLNEQFCWVLWLLGPKCLQCPKPSTPNSPPVIDGFTVSFTNFTCAVQAADYLTYGLVDTVDDCIEMCDSVTGCNFVNTYHDVNGKNGSTQLTCSLFESCHTTSDADNCGGQTQPNGSVDFITTSAGYCRENCPKK